LEADTHHQQLAASRDSWGNPGILADSERKQAMQMWKAKNASHIRTASATATRGKKQDQMAWTQPSGFPMAESARNDFAIGFSDG